MTRRTMMLGLFAASFAGESSALAHWGKKRGNRRPGLFHLPEPVSEEDDDRVKTGRSTDYHNDGYQGYNLGAFDWRSVKSRDPHAPATTGFPLLRFRLRHR